MPLVDSRCHIAAEHFESAEWLLEMELRFLKLPGTSEGGKSFGLF